MMSLNDATAHVNLKFQAHTGFVTRCHYMTGDDLSTFVGRSKDCARYIHVIKI